MPSRKLFEDLTADLALPYTHTENLFVDFDRDRLIYHMLSTEGPRMALGDVNGDGLEDVFIGGAKDSPGRLLVQVPGGRFIPSNEAVFEADKASEDLQALLFDADNDGDADLYVCSGGHEFSESSSALMDRLYFNDGRGNLRKANVVLPASKFESSSCVEAADYDADGDLDLFVGIRVRPFLYGVPANGYILQNDGKGNFRNVTPQVAPALKEVGMVTDALWFDYDRDGDPDLLLAGEWMPLRLFENQGGRFEEVTEAAGLAGTAGWWNVLAAADLDQDGDLDVVAGNHGLNSRFKASPERPVSCYVNDFDRNGSAEQIIAQYNGDRSYPLVLRHDLVMQLPHLKKKYLKYEAYQNQTVEDIFTPEELEGAIVHEVTTLETSLLLNRGDGTFEVRPLPVEAQFAPVYAILPRDFDGDGRLDLLLGGNLYGAKPEVGRYDASYGTLLLGDGHGSFRTLRNVEAGLWLEGEVRDFRVLSSPLGELLLVARNDAPLQVLRLKPTPTLEQ